jgi:pilus assembly protein Flp/PilA
MNRLLASVRRFATQAEAATMIEYGMVLLLVAVVCVAAVSYIGSNLVLPMYQIIQF